MTEVEREGLQALIDAIRALNEAVLGLTIRVEVLERQRNELFQRMLSMDGSR